MAVSGQIRTDLPKGQNGSGGFVQKVSASYDVAVVGGGAIGLACAWRVSQRGAKTIVLDAGEPGAWHVAAGMLAPVSEAEFGERELLQLGLESANRYETFVSELDDAGYRAVGTMVVARDRDEAEALDRLAEFRRGLGLPVERLRPSQARRLEPALAPTIRLALKIDTDHSVDPRKLVAALRRAYAGGEVPASGAGGSRAGATGAGASAGGELRRARATGLRVDGERVTGVVLAGGDEIAANAVVVAAGCDVARLDMPEHARVPVRPVKGQVLRLNDPNGPGLVERTIRGEHAYFVPRGDGHYILGATMEERGWDTTPTAGGVYELLRDLSELVPGIFELEIEELIAGLRPTTPDNLPAIGRGALEGLIWATGHHRNGILLTPVTADLVAAACSDEPLPEWAAPADPLRFAGVHA